METYSPQLVHIPKATGVTDSSLISAHLYTEKGHADGRNYVANEYPAVKTYEMMGLWSGENHVTATSGNILSHQGVTSDGSNFYTSDSAKLYKWTSIGVTPVADGTNPSNLTPFAALELETGLSQFDHIGGIDHVPIAGTGYILAPCGDDPDANPVGIAAFTEALAYVAGSFTNFTGLAGRISAVSGDSTTNKLYFTEYHATAATVISECTLSDVLTGSLAAEREITLNWPIVNINGLIARGGRLYVAWNSAASAMHQVTVFDTNGNPLFNYRGTLSSGGPEDIHLQGDILYWLKSTAVGQGQVMTVDLAAAQPATTNDGTGLEISNEPSVYNMALYQPVKATIGASFTRVIRFSVLTATSSRNMHECLDDGDSSYWVMDLVKSGLNVYLRFYARAGGQGLIQTPAEIVVDQEHTIAVTASKVTSPSFSATFNIYLDGVFKATSTITTVNDWLNPTGFSIGRSNKSAGSSHVKAVADFIYDGVKTEAELLAIHNDYESQFIIGS